MDIREILNALSPEDRLLWSQCRTDMRRNYLNAHNQTMGIHNWDHTDDAFLDMIDIKLAILFDRSGKLVSTKSIIGDSSVTEAEILATKIGSNDNSAAKIPEWQKANDAHIVAQSSKDLLPASNQGWGSMQ